MFPGLRHELIRSSFHGHPASQVAPRTIPNGSSSPVTRSTVAISIEVPSVCRNGWPWLARCRGTAARNARPCTSRSLVARRSNRIVATCESIAPSNLRRNSSAAAESRISGNTIVPSLAFDASAGSVRAADSPGGAIVAGGEATAVCGAVVAITAGLSTPRENGFQLGNDVLHQPAEDLLEIGIRVLGRCRNLLQQVDPTKQDINVSRRELDAALLGRDETVFHDVSDPAGRINPDDPRGPLDRMGRPHHLIDARRIAGSTFQREKSGAQHFRVGFHLGSKKINQ